MTEVDYKTYIIQDTILDEVHPLPFGYNIRVRICTIDQDSDTYKAPWHVFEYYSTSLKEWKLYGVCLTEASARNRMYWFIRQRNNCSMG